MLVATGGAGGRLGISSAAVATAESGTNGGAVPDRVEVLVVVGVALDSAEGVDVGSGVAARGSAGVAAPEGAFDAGTEDSCPSICFCHNSGRTSIKRFLYQQSGSLGLRRASAGKGDGRTGELTGVDSTARNQLVVRPRLDDQAILEDMDHVAVDNGRQAVRNNDRGPPLQELAQAVLDQALVERVEGRGLIPR